MTAPEHQASGLDANARGIIVLVVAVAVGLLLLFKAGDGGSSEAVSSGSPSTTIEVGGSDDTTTTLPVDDGTGATTTTGATTDTSGGGTARPVAEVNVLVLNGSGVGGAAASITTDLGGAGYQMGAASDAATPNDGATVVYFAEGYEADAAGVITVLGKGTAQPKPAESLGTGSEEANVVVALGKADTTPAN